MSRTGIVTYMAIGAIAVASIAFTEPPLAEVNYFSTSVEFSTRVWDQGFLLKVATPGGAVVEKIIKDSIPRFDLAELEGGIVDGRYKYELHPIVALPRQRDVAPHKADPEPRVKASSLSGSFIVKEGSIVSSGSAEREVLAGGPDAPDDQVISDELIVQGCACLGLSCVDGVSFPDQTQLMLRYVDTGIMFDDTDTSGGSYSYNDWHIQANQMGIGGANYLGFLDVTGGTRPFTIEAGAADNVLVVDVNDRVGINTSTPASELHVCATSSPVITMEQTGGVPYRWDINANDDYLYVHDVSGGAYQLVIENYEAGPIYGVVLKEDGKVGQGTNSPTYQFEVFRSGVNSNVVVTRDGGATNYINATASFGNFGTVTDHPLRLAVNGTWQMRINSSSAIQMANGAYLSAGGVWTDASSRTHKKDIKSLSIEKATAALADLDPVEFVFKSNGERHVGFIAEDVPELVAGADRNGLSPMDVVAVLTRIVQRQKEIIEYQQQKLQEQARINEQHQATFSSILARITKLESK